MPHMGHDWGIWKNLYFMYVYLIQVPTLMLIVNSPGRPFFKKEHHPKMPSPPPRVPLL
jgi:hypothetical protein